MLLGVAGVVYAVIVAVAAIKSVREVAVKQFGKGTDNKLFFYVSFYCGFIELLLECIIYSFSSAYIVLDSY